MSSTRAISLMHASPLAAGVSVHDSPGEQRGMLGFVLLAFMLSCVFDPADTVLGLKVWLFVLCWVYTLFAARTSSRMQAGVSPELLIYTLFFILVPVLSMVLSWPTSVSDSFEGFNLLKGYLLITLAPMLVLNRINLLPRLCAVLTVLALVVIGAFIVLQLDPAFYDVLSEFGASTGIVSMGNRDYGSDLELLQIYFVTSPMLAISTAYYFSRAHSAPRPGAKWLLWGLVVINVLGLLLAGTRNNILAAFLLPIVLSLSYARRKIIGALVSLAVVAVLSVVFVDELQAFFDPMETSNYVKLLLLDDYSRIFSDPLIFLFGQGLGAYDYFAGRGYLYVTELTYLELVRNFGLLGAMVMIGLLLFPVWHAFAANRPRGEKAIALGFASYLVMCFSNPNLIGSMGTLLLSVILGNIFRSNSTDEKSMTRGRQ